MKPRPIFTLYIVPRGPQTRFLPLQCRRYSSRSPILSYLRIAQCHDHPHRKTHHAQYISLRPLRYASSSTAAATKPTTPAPAKPSKSSVPAKTQYPTSPRPQPNTKLNPSPETYAPPLSVPSRQPHQNYFSYLWAAGRAYLTFYKTGIANVRQTARIAKKLREKASQSPSQGEGIASVLTRAEWQIVRRSRRDMFRLPAFALLLLVFGEWTPLLVVWMTGVVPEACRVPAQVKKELEKAERRRRERERRLALDAPRLIHADRQLGVGQSASNYSTHPRILDVEEVKKLDLFRLLAVSGRLDAHSGIWDRLFVRPPKALLRWSVERRLKYLKKDDSLIERDGGYQGLGREELQRACVERGIDVLGKSEADLRRSLAMWFTEKRMK